MNGLASLLRYQMGGPVGYVTGGQIDDIYNTLFGRQDAEGRAYYEERLKNASVADAIAIIGGGATGEDVNEGLRQKIADETIKAAYENVLGRPEDVAGLQFYQDQVLNQGLDPTQIDDIFADSPEAQVRKDAEEFLRRLEAGEDVTGIGTPLDTSQFTAPITPSIAADLIGRAQTVGVPNSEFDKYGGYDAVKNVYDASGGAGPGVVTDDTVVDGVETIDLPTRTTPPNVDTTNLFTSTGDTRAVTGPPVPDYGYINDLYKTYLGRDASPEELASYAGIFGPTIEPNEIKDFILGGVTSNEISQERANDLLRTLPAATPGSNQILGIPKFARQIPSDLEFAPLRRGLAQLRPAMSMTGLTSGQAAFGGVAPTPGQSPPDLITAQDRAKELIDRTYRTVLNRNPTQVGYDFYLPKILSGEFNANNIIPALVGGATSGPDKEIAANYAIQNPSAAQPFTLQTGAYGAPTPTFLARPEKAAEPFPTDPKPLTDPAPVATDREGGLIKMAEGGEPPTPPPMSKLDTLDLGSTFDIADYIDDQGRLVGGYSKPIYDENRVITGYDYRPYERDVVFGELRDKEAAMQLTDAEREQMMVEMAMRQGRTGISPTTGGLAGISTDNLMPSYMRRQPQYYSTVEQFRPRYAEGGLANAAQNLAARGRYGDSTLVHMAPEELSGLRALARAQGNDMTINPRTGLPEAFSLRKLFKAASFILPFVPIPGLFGMSSLLTKSILSGVAAGASAKGGFDFKQALGGGLKAYALGSLGEKMGGGPTPGGGPTTPPVNVDPAAGGVEVGVNMTGPDAGFALSQGGPEALNTGSAAPISRVDAGFANVSDPGTIIKPGMAPMTSSAPDIAGALPPGVDTVPGRMANVITPKGQGFGPAPLTKGTEIAMAGLGGFSLEKAAEEQRRYDMEAAAIRQEEEERERRFEELARRTLGQVAVKSGGQINLAKGGMTYMEGGGTTDVTGEPRMVQGTGDGMSDSVPATIEGVQEARLANDEFVIPADVVADIGNGSSNAGAKKLYNMMDRIRKARHGTTKQPPEIRAERLMPA
jgi:hypothetical protein